MIPLPGVVYFVSMTVGMLYINMVLARPAALGGRLAQPGALGATRWCGCSSLLVALAAFDVLVSRTGVRADVSRRATEHAVCAVDRLDQADPQGPAGLHPGVLQPRGAP